jgi:hypothetical protein
VGELLNEAGFEPGGVTEPSGEEEYIVLLDISAGGEPEMGQESTFSVE